MILVGNNKVVWEGVPARGFPIPIGVCRSFPQCVHSV